MSKSFSIKERITLAKRLAFLIQAGMPLVESLRIIKKQTSSKSKIKLFETLLSDVSNGQYFSTSLTKSGVIFDQFSINIIRVGEESGTLDQNLNYLAEELKKKQSLQRKVWSALIYPLFIVISTFGVTGLIMLFVFPKVLPIFKSLNIALPLTTRLLIFINDLILGYGLYIFGFVVLLIITAMIMLRRKKMRLWFDSLILRLPVIGQITRTYQVVNCCRTLGLLLKSDVPITKAFESAADAATNLIYSKELRALSRKINSGDKIATLMEKHRDLFPPLLSHMVSIGETTGRLDETFSYVAELYENELDDSTKNFAILLEPALMIFMGVVVGFIAVSIISPIYAITQNLHP